MINKKNLWFLTLFSLVLVLSIYYVTMPNEILNTSNNNTKIDNTNTEIKETSVIGALKLEEDSTTLEEIKSLKEKLTSSEISTEEKNEVFEELKLINKNSSLEETLESKIKKEYNCETFVKVEGDKVRVIMDYDEGNTTIANNIMRMVQKEFDEKMYISVKFN